MYLFKTQVIFTLVHVMTSFTKHSLILNLLFQYQICKIQFTYCED